METATYTGILFILAGLAFWGGKRAGHEQGYREGVLDYYNADEAERAAMLRDTLQ